MQRELFEKQVKTIIDNELSRQIKPSSSSLSIEYIREQVLHMQTIYDSILSLNPDTKGVEFLIQQITKLNADLKLKDEEIARLKSDSRSFNPYGYTQKITTLKPSKVNDSMNNDVFSSFNNVFDSFFSNK